MCLSAQEVYTILCLPAMGQEHVLTAPLAEGNAMPSSAPPATGLAAGAGGYSVCQCDCNHHSAGTSFRSAVQHLASTLKRVEVFYNSIGGLLGYQHKSLQIMNERQQHADTPCSGNSREGASFHMPQGPNLAGPNGQQLAAQSAAAGLDALPHMAEIYPLGGLPLSSCVCS